MKHITKEDALRALEEAVAEKGEDYIYQYTDSDDPRNSICLYVYDGAPSCIAGDALHRLGIPLSAFEDHEGDTIDKVALRVDWPLHVDAVDVLYEAQCVQDGGRSWGEALAAAREAVRRAAVEL